MVEGMGSLGAGVANAITGETVQTAARGLEVLISDPGGAAATIGQAALDQGKALMHTAAAVASDPAGAAALLNDNPRALGRFLGQAAGDLALAKLAKDAGGEGGAGCGLNSFAPDTPVLTAEGVQAIGTLEIGDEVLAYDQASGRLGRFPITHVWVHRDAVLVDLRIDQTLIETTPAHPFFTAEAGWVNAGALWAGAHIRTAAGTAGLVQQLAVVARTQLMYNLTVATAHTFFVGRGQWLVHNACPGSSRQFGTKFGEHKADYPGMTHQEYRQLADAMYDNPNLPSYIYPKDAPVYAGETHIVEGPNLLRLDPRGNFRSLYPGAYDLYGAP